ncbi:MAG TPA: competence/damage-inducible protein A [Archaeoglobaceae archaeon]|nr:competence/damage-inducible protein A [Archaeoglobaceae archaeon]
MDFIIISVGNEILSGDIVNTNSAYIAKKLTQSGHRVLKMVTIPDEVEVIAEEVANASKNAEFVLVTGGLGVTHDDVTTEGIAKATKRELVINKDVYSFLKTRMKSEEAMKKMATLPEGSEAINNLVGAAPGFIVNNIAVMPGVPAEMEYIMEKLLERYGSADYFEERVMVEGFEDRIVKKLNSVVEEFKDVNIGSYPKSGHIIIKFSGKDKERVKKARKKFQSLIR